MTRLGAGIRDYQTLSLISSIPNILKKEDDMTTSLKGKDILHGNQFSKKDIDAIMKTASYFEKALKRKDQVACCLRERSWPPSSMSQAREPDSLLKPPCSG